MKHPMIGSVWCWRSEVAGKNFPYPPSVVMGMQVDNVAIDIRVLDSELHLQCLLTLLENIGFG